MGTETSSIVVLIIMIVLSCSATAKSQGRSPVRLEVQPSQSIRESSDGVYLVDFERVAFGNLMVTPPATGGRNEVTFRFGEALENNRVNATPPGSVRFAEVKVQLDAGVTKIVAPPPDARNTKPPAVLSPVAFGTLLPFRWVEVQGWPGKLQPLQIVRRAAFDATWKDEDASFHSADPMLDRVWDLCHYSIKATSFAGVFVDGDRERLAYEADAYLNQMGYYASDANSAMPRATFDRLVRFPTWPSEWAPHMVFMALADWMETGDRVWLAKHYEFLKSKLLTDRVGPDGLVRSTPALIKKGDLVDWPIQERDQFVFTDVNTVVNAFRLKALKDMSQLAQAVGKTEDAAMFVRQEKAEELVFQDRLFDREAGLFRDGVGTDHTSFHANLFPLAFGLVPPANRTKVAAWLAGRGMAGSVYAAQYLLQGLFENGQDRAAIALMIAPGDRSWRHMVESGATITWEAWDQKYKPNQDWNHAWGAAPANLLPNLVLGMQPLTPGWGRALIQPHPGGLSHAEGKMPTPRGELNVAWDQTHSFTLTIALPSSMTAMVKLPEKKDSTGIWINGAPAKAHRKDGWWLVDKDVSGTVRVEER